MMRHFNLVMAQPAVFIVRRVGKSRSGPTFRGKTRLGEAAPTEQKLFEK
jgi:hypothetical protein